MMEIEQPLLPEDFFDPHEDMENLEDSDLFFPLNRIDMQLGDFSGAVRIVQMLLIFWIFWLSFIIMNLVINKI